MIAKASRRTFAIASLVLFAVQIVRKFNFLEEGLMEAGEKGKCQSRMQCFNLLHSLKENSPIEYMYHWQQIKAFEQAICDLEALYAKTYSLVVKIGEQIAYEKAPNKPWPPTR